MNIKKLLTLHSNSIISGLQTIIKSPIEHMLNLLSIALVVTILSSALIITQNIEKWQKQSTLFPQIIIYLSNDASQVDVTKLENSINHYNLKLIKNYQFISKEQGLESLKQDQHLKSIASEVISMDENNSNPLPDVLIINTNTAEVKLLQQLVNKIRTYTKVQEVQMDDSYANKLNNLAVFIKYVAGTLQLLFTLLLVIVIYNMIRQQMFIRQDEIIVSRLIGASNSFIMRPLTYYAIIQTSIATLIAYGLINWFITYLNSLFLNLNSLFGQEFLLTTLNQFQLLQMLFILIAFTIFSVFIAVHTVFRNSYTQ